MYVCVCVCVCVCGGWCGVYVWVCVCGVLVSVCVCAPVSGQVEVCRGWSNKCLRLQSFVRFSLHMGGV